MEMEEGGGEGRAGERWKGSDTKAREDRRGDGGVRGFGGGLKERFKEKLWSRIRAGWKKEKKKGF